MKDQRQAYLGGILGGAAMLWATAAPAGEGTLAGRGRGDAATAAATATSSAPAAPTAEEAERQARNLPPISIDLTNATADQAIVALNEALNTARKIPRDNRSGSSFTLHAENRPFWEVFLALNAQNNLLAGRDAKPQDPGSYIDPLRYHAIDGPVMGFIQYAGYSRAVDFQAPGGPRRTVPAVRIDIHLRVDPRVGNWGEVSQSGKFTKIVDDLGQDLTANFSYTGTTTTPAAVLGDANRPPRIGRTLSATYETSILYMPLNFTPIAELPADVGKAMAIDRPSSGGRFGPTTATVSYQVNEFGAQPDGNIHMRYEVTSNRISRGEGSEGGSGGGVGGSSGFVLLDANGKMVWSSLDPETRQPIAARGEGPAIVIPAGNSKAPYKFLLATPVVFPRNGFSSLGIEVPIHLEFKDFPLRGSAAASRE